MNPLNENFLESSVGNTLCWRDAKISDLGIVHAFYGAGQDLKNFSKEYTTTDDNTRVRLLKQTHSTSVLSLKDSGKDGDAFFITKGEGAVGIKTADCVPLIFVSSDRSHASVVHAGWKGAVDNIVLEVLKEFQIKSIPFEDLIVAIGPAAQSCCYEIGDEVEDEFKSNLRSISVYSALRNSISVLIDESIPIESCFYKIFRQENDKKYVSVSGLLQLQLKLAGVKEENIHSMGICTICDSRFYSFRREGESSGRQLSYVAL